MLTRSASPTVGSARYRAFLSYSHLDRTIGIAVQRGLQRLARPWYRPPAFRIFRDDTDLTATPRLWSSIEEALLDAEFFILLASPAAAASPWVDREVATWMDRKPPDRLMLALTDGELGWDSAVGDFDRAKTTVLPPTLRGAFREEPRWVDLRALRESGDLSLRNQGFRDCVADLAAPLHASTKERLIGEDVRRKRQRNRLRNSVMVVLAVLLALAAAASILFLQQRNVARKQQRIATARQLLAQADLTRAADPRTALRLGIAANHVNPGAETASSLAQTLLTTHYAGILSAHTAAVTAVAFAPDGRTAATGSSDQTAIIWDMTHPAGPAPLATLTGHASGLTSLAFAPDGTTLATGSWDGTVILWDVTDRTHPTHIATFAGHTHSVVAVAFAPDGRTLASQGNDGATILWDVSARGQPTAIGAPLTGVSAFAFTPEGRLVTIRRDGMILWDLSEPGRPARLSAVDAASVSELAFARDGHLAAAGGVGDVSLWAVSGRRVTRSAVLGERNTSAFALAPDGRTLATAVAMPRS